MDAGMELDNVVKHKPGKGLTSRLLSTQALVVAGGLGVGGLVSLAGAGLGVGAVLGLAFFLVSLKTVRPALLITVAMMMLFGRDEVYEFSIPFAGGGLKPSDLLLGVTLGAWLIRVVVLRVTVLPLPKFFSIMMLLFLLQVGVSAAMGISSGNNFKDALLELRPLLQYLLVFPLMAEFDTVKLKQAVWFFLAVSVVSSIRILVNYWQGVGQVLLFGEGIRVVLLELGAYLPPVMIGMVYAMFRIHTRLSLGVGLLNLAALAVTFFRSAYLGLSGGMFFIFLLAEARIKRMMLILLLFVTLGGVAGGVAYTVLKPKSINPFESVITRILSLREYREDISSLHRLREWESATSLIGKSPVWGNGLGTRIVFESPMYSADSQRLGYLSHDIYIHNSYMWMLVKMGGAGLATFLVVWLTAMYTARKSLASVTDPGDRALLLALAGVLAGNMVISVFGPMFNIDNMTPINAFILGSVFILAREAPTKWEMEI